MSARMSDCCESNGLLLLCEKERFEMLLNPIFVRYYLYYDSDAKVFFK
jgi:hypothetical protein